MLAIHAFHICASDTVKITKIYAAADAEADSVYVPDRARRQ